MVSWYTRRYGGVDADPDEDPFRCIHDECVELAVDDALAERWACVHCIACEAEELA
jgi:hypothetical protein